MDACEASVRPTFLDGFMATKNIVFIDSFAAGYQTLFLLFPGYSLGSGFSIDGTLTTAICLGFGCGKKCCFFMSDSYHHLCRQQDRSIGVTALRHEMHS
jgi:hypothetical protein